MRHPRKPGTLSRLRAVRVTPMDKVIIASAGMYEHEDEDPHVHHLVPLSAHDRGKICCDCNLIIEADD